MNTLEKKGIAICVILSIVTCGIYGIYWWYCIIRDINTISGDPDSMSPVMVILLGIVTCNIYTLYWVYKTGTMLDQKAVEEGGQSGNRGILYLLLSFFGLGIITFCLLQDSINKYADNAGSIDNKSTF